MAERRMFAKTIIDSDAFLDMPLSAQALYFHLSMRADDEGFINNPKKIQRMIGAADDDMKVLTAKNFVIPFETGIVVIKHWRIHNYIRADRLVETKYKEERKLLEVKENGAYTLNGGLLEIEDLSCDEKRKRAYENSTLPYSFTYKIRRAFERHTCPVCGTRMSSSFSSTCPSVQHNIPIAKGGEHEIYNISVICKSCNSTIRDKETGELNNKEVMEMWDRIVYADSHDIKWFDRPEILNDIDAGQLTVKCPTSDSIGKVRLGKDSIDKDRLVEGEAPGHNFDKHTNRLNYQYIKESTDIESVEYLKTHDDLNECVVAWLKYKDERKPKSTNHYGETGLIQLLNKIYKQAADYGDATIIGVIEDSMSSNYQGIVWDRIKGKPKQEQNVYDAWANA